MGKMKFWEGQGLRCQKKPEKFLPLNGQRSPNHRNPKSINVDYLLKGSALLGFFISALINQAPIRSTADFVPWNVSKLFLLVEKTVWNLGFIKRYLSLQWYVKILKILTTSSFLCMQNSDCKVLFITTPIHPFLKTVDVSCGDPFVGAFPISSDCVRSRVRFEPKSCSIGTVGHCVVACLVFNFKKVEMVW